MIPIAPFPGHWQSRLGPQPLQSEPWMYPSPGSSDCDCPYGGWGYWLTCRFTRVSDALSSFWACHNQEKLKSINNKQTHYSCFDFTQN